MREIAGMEVVITCMIIMGIGYDAIMIMDIIQSGLHQNISLHFTTDLSP